MGSIEESKPVKKEKKLELFELLKTKGVCHAVCVSMESMRLKGVDSCSKEWFIIISVEDKKILMGYGFKKSEGRLDVVEKELTDEEVAKFKSIQEANYIKILHNKDGRIYEQKNYSLSQQLDNE